MKARIFSKRFTDPWETHALLATPLLCAMAPALCAPPAAPLPQPPWAVVLTCLPGRFPSSGPTQRSHPALCQSLRQPLRGTRWRAGVAVPASLLPSGSLRLPGLPALAGDTWAVNAASPCSRASCPVDTPLLSSWCLQVNCWLLVHDCSLPAFSRVATPFAVRIAFKCVFLCSK